MSVIISTRLSMLSGGICVSGAKARMQRSPVAGALPSATELRMVEAMPSAPNTERGRRRYNWVWYRILRRSNWPARSRPTQAKDDDIPYRRDLYLRRLIVGLSRAQVPNFLPCTPYSLNEIRTRSCRQSLTIGRLRWSTDASLSLGMPRTSCVRVQQWECRSEGGTMTLRNCLTLDQYDSLRPLVGHEVVKWVATRCVAHRVTER
jgi:hypothetical protein